MEKDQITIDIKTMEKDQITIDELLKTAWCPFTFEKQKTKHGYQMKIWKGSDAAFGVCIDDHFMITKTDVVIRIKNDNILLTLWEGGYLALTDYTNVNNLTKLDNFITL